MSIKRYFLAGFLVALIVIAFGCKNVSRYPIDDKRSLRIDTDLLGIWKVDEDSDKANYFVFDSYHDVFHGNQEGNEGDWYRERRANKDYDYYVTRVSSHGLNPEYNQWNVFVSEVGGQQFFTIGNTDCELHGYIFLKIIKINGKKNRLTACVVADTTLISLGSSKEVRDRIQHNLNNPAFYRDTMHFRKISSARAPSEELYKIANHPFKKYRYEVEHNGNKFVLERPHFKDTLKITDPTTGNAIYKIMYAWPFPVSMNGKKVYDITDVHLSSAMVSPNVPVEEMILANIPHTFNPAYVEDSYAIFTASLDEIVVDETGKILFNDFWFAHFTGRDKIRRAVSLDADKLFEGIQLPIAIRKGKKVPYKQRIYLNRYIIEIKNHIISYRPA